MIFYLSIYAMLIINSNFSLSHLLLLLLLLLLELNVYIDCCCCLEARFINAYKVDFAWVLWKFVFFHFNWILKAIRCCLLVISLFKIAHRTNANSIVFLFIFYCQGKSRLSKIHEYITMHPINTLLRIYRKI